MQLEGPAHPAVGIKFSAEDLAWVIRSNFLKIDILSKWSRQFGHQNLKNLKYINSEK